MFQPIKILPMNNDFSISAVDLEHIYTKFINKSIFSEKYDSTELFINATNTYSEIFFESLINISNPRTAFYKQFMKNETSLSHSLIDVKALETYYLSLV